MYEEIDVISKEKVLDLIGNPDTIIVNVLGKHSFDRVHIRNSISIPLNILEDGGWRDLPKEKLIITYCHSESCNASKRAASILKENGFPKVAAYEGGISEWSENRLPSDGMEAENAEIRSE